MASIKTDERHRWRFHQLGGFDQVIIDSAEDLRHLGQLDQKLWAALSCPVRGVEFDAHTLRLLDSDADGRIRVPELLQAVEWVCRVLKDPAAIFSPAAEGLPLEAIDTSSEEGRTLHASARRILANLGKGSAAHVSVEDTADTTRIFIDTPLNGDGVVPASAATEETVAQAVRDVMACVGSLPDRGGEQGIDRTLLETFLAEARALLDWWHEAQAEPDRLRPLGEASEEAAALFAKVRPKIDDYFTRSRLVAFDPKAVEYLNPGEAHYSALAALTLSPELGELAALPLARAEADQPLALDRALNPGWAATLAQFRETIVKPLLGEVSRLGAEQWADLSARFAAHEAWMARKPASRTAELGPERLEALTEPGMAASLNALIDQDLALQGEAEAIAAVDRLVHYYLHLDTLLHNFVNLRDFYSRQRRAIFQAGTLYLDGRSCELCVDVENLEKHSALANLSQIYLAYCECRRRGGEEKRLVAAAVTGGDADRLMVGRNGVFYDRRGVDWDATVVHLVEHPISVRQAFWSPFKRIARLVGEQVQKFATSRDQAVEQSAAKGLTDITSKAEKGKPKAEAPATPFDIGKFAGIFAAIGLAVGAIGTAIASLAADFLSLEAWEMPLAVGGLVLLVSGPSMLLAWLKLRRRNLGPILDANGWAVNTQARINIPFGTTLTATAALPREAQRSLRDPYAEKDPPWRLWLTLVVIAIALGGLWQTGVLGAVWDRMKQRVEAIEAAEQARDEAEAAAAAAAEAEAAAPAAEAPPAQ